MPRLTIIIPSYNAETFLPRCLDSIMSQDFDDFEVIVIDDGSTDGTAAILKRRKADNLRIISQANRGMATARNRGLDKATGEYVMFVDSDDRLCPNALATLVPQLQGEDIVGFGTKIFNEANGTYTDNPIAPSATMAGWDYFNLHRLKPTPVHFVCIWQRVYRRAFLEECGLRFVDGLRRAEDDLFTTMAFLHARRVKTIANSMYIYHVRPDSITRCSDPRLEADSRRVQQILADTFLPMDGIDKRAICQVLASNYINRLAAHSDSLSPAEWRQFRQACVTPRHRRLYRMLRTSPLLYRIYSRLASFLKQ